LIYGLDTNILCYALDPAFAENNRCRRILLEASAESKLGLNPTVLHESYHTLVYSQKWAARDARQRLVATLQHPYVEFYNQSRRISIMALDLAVHHSLGGRDSLILANLMANNVPVLYTHDSDLLDLKQVTEKSNSIRLEDPLKP
jgi:predicted nucleic acid-binding protein